MGPPTGVRVPLIGIRPCSSSGSVPAEVPTGSLEDSVGVPGSGEEDRDPSSVEEDDKYPVVLYYSFVVTNADQASGSCCRLRNLGRTCPFTFRRGRGLLITGNLGCLHLMGLETG